jgi:hypothetical protein
MVSYLALKGVYLRIHKSTKYCADKQTASAGFPSWLLSCGHLTYLYYIKETVSRDFRPLVFFINQLPLGP